MSMGPGEPRVGPGELETLIDPAAEPALLGSGYQFTEGPVWSARDNCLYFSDIPGDARWRWSESGGPELVARPTFKGNGMAYGVDGNLLVCEHVTSSVASIRADGVREVIAFHYRGTYLNSPNDVVTRAVDGGIYFTDPDYGRWNNIFGIERIRELGFKGLYRVPRAGGECELLVDEDELDQPNGLCFSPDEKLLYVNDSAQATIKVWDVQQDGLLANGRLFAGGIGTGEVGSAPDGMECDELGNVWVTAPGGVWVINPAGENIGVVAVPEVVGSLAWGGQDLRSLFLTSSTTLRVVETRVRSALVPGNH
jgi:gluconolactonase